MKLRTWLVVGVGILLVSLVILQARVIAQRAFKGDAVLSAYGFIVEEVKVGGSCVVVVSAGAGGPTRQFVAVPCTP